jgi:Fe-S-cluster-containing hydrogenase component 2
MIMVVIIDGVLTAEELDALPCMPSPQRMARGAVAVIECSQDIPCNPCQTACPTGAILVGDPITNVPVLKEDLCNGCGLCVAPCPGLAIFIVDLNHREGEAAVSLPYEFLPLPETGDKVDALDRSGNPIHEGTIVRVQNPASFDKTAVVTVAVPKISVMEIRNIRIK